MRLAFKGPIRTHYRPDECLVGLSDRGDNDTTNIKLCGDGRRQRRRRTGKNSSIKRRRVRPTVATVVGADENIIAETGESGADGISERRSALNRIDIAVTNNFGKDGGMVAATSTDLKNAVASSNIK